MTAVTATEFAKGFGRYKEEAQREPVAITSYGRVSGYFVSAREFDELQRLRAFERRVHRIKDLPAEVAEEMTRRGPKANLAEFPRVGHAPALMDPTQIGLIAEFLRS